VSKIEPKKIVIGLVVAFVALTVWNDQLTLLPWGLSRILGITVHLGIPPALPLVATAIGATLAAAGTTVALLDRRPSRGGRPA